MEIITLKDAVKISSFQQRWRVGDNWFYMWG
ncbi:MAG: hypothetical protein [Bacteriophage sp.]|nr:MAG: hypothetical protein [Bacteriophage sp.]